MAKVRPSLTNRDKSILKFLWRWKIISSSAIFHKFYPTMKPMTAYRKLMKLKQRGLIKTVHLPGTNGHGWSLNDKGFKYVKSVQPEMAVQGYKSGNPDHDFTTSTLHIGNWMMGAPIGCEVFSEQELKCYDPDFYPHWIPRLENHRSDGYWYIENDNGKHIISLEVETSQKAKRRYIKVKDFYDYFDAITTVVWVATDLPMAKRLLQLLSKDGANKKDKHNFLLLNDILKSNWGSKFVLGPLKGISFNDYMLNLAGQSRATPGQRVAHLLLTDTRLARVNSGTCKTRF